MEKKKLTSFQKVERECQERRGGERSFQMIGGANAKERQPVVYK